MVYKGISKQILRVIYVVFTNWGFTKDENILPRVTGGGCLKSYFYVVQTNKELGWWPQPG